MRSTPDVTELRDFYRSPIGELARRLLAERIRQWWPSVKGDNVYGLGFAAPYLTPFVDESLCLGALMPARQGVLLWPPGRTYRSLLVDDCDLPLLDGAADRIVLVHCLEMSESPHDLLREVWRVLSPQGHLLVIVPNRRGVWARFDTTPFGHGRPYSRGQLRRVLSDARFSLHRFGHALCTPPSSARLSLRTAPSLEKLGKVMWPAFSGVMLAEARKEVYAPVGTKKQVLRSEVAMPVPAVPMAAKLQLTNGEKN